MFESHHRGAAVKAVGVREFFGFAESCLYVSSGGVSPSPALERNDFLAGWLRFDWLPYIVSRDRAKSHFSNPFQILVHSQFRCLGLLVIVAQLCSLGAAPMPTTNTSHTI
jgi:hypothetical protein